MENFRDAELKKWLAEEYEKETEEMEKILFPDGVIPDDGDTEEEATRRKGCTMILLITLQPFQHPAIRIPSLHQSRDIVWSTPWVPLPRFRSGRD